jgi:ketosteroid isomerase-like protein
MSRSEEITQERANDLMTRFGQAFVSRDDEALRSCLGDGFFWHLHEGPDIPNGKTVSGLEGMLDVLQAREKNWQEVRYSDVSVTTDGSQIIQTFRVSGIDESGRAFDVRAVDLYAVEGGKLASKDSYWKNVDRR